MAYSCSSHLHSGWVQISSSGDVALPCLLCLAKEDGYGVENVGNVDLTPAMLHSSLQPRLRQHLRYSVSLPQFLRLFISQLVTPSLSLSQFLHLFVSQSVSPSLCLSVSFTVSLSLSQFLRLFVFQSVSLSFCLSVRVTVSLSLSKFLRLFVSQ